MIPVAAGKGDLPLVPGKILAAAGEEQRRPLGAVEDRDQHRRRPEPLHGQFPWRAAAQHLPDAVADLPKGAGSGLFLGENQSTTS